MKTRRIEVDEGHFLTVLLNENADVSEAVSAPHTQQRNLPAGAEPVSRRDLSGIPRMLDEQIEGLTAIARKVISSANPDSLELEAGITFGGSAGIPLITSAEGEISIKVKLSWSNGND